MGKYKQKSQKVKAFAVKPNENIAALGQHSPDISKASKAAYPGRSADLDFCALMPVGAGPCHRCSVLFALANGPITSEPLFDGKFLPPFAVDNV